MRRGLAVLLVCVMLVTLVPVSATAATVVETGTVGDGGAPWRLYSDGTLVVEEGFIEWDDWDGVRYDWRSPWHEHRLSIHTITFTGPIICGGSLAHLFYGLIVNSIEGLDHFDTSNVTDMGSMFAQIGNLESLDLSGWDTSNVANMGGMFTQTGSLKNLDLSGWDTSNVTNMSTMFQMTFNLRSLDLSSFDTSNVTDMGNMFYASNLNRLTLGERFNFIVNDTWDGNPRLPEVPADTYVRAWRNVGLGTVANPQGSFIFTSDELMRNFNGETMADTWVWSRRAADEDIIAYGMVGEGGAPWRLYGSGTLVVEEGVIDWDGCPWITQGPWSVHSPDIRKMIFTAPITAGTSLRSLFVGLVNLIVIEGLEHFDTSAVTDMSYMFLDTVKLESVDLSSWDTGSVLNMRYMFANILNLESLDLSAWDTSNVTDMNNMFASASNLTSLDLSGWDTGNVTNMGGMFSHTQGLECLNVSGWDTSSVTNMGGMFAWATSLESLELSGWNTGNVTDMSGMFGSAHRLTSLDLSTWDTGNVADMNTMFAWTISLKSLELSGWNTSSVTDMSHMFAGASSLTSLDLSAWDIGNVTNMSYMFAWSNLNVPDWGADNASNLANLNLSGWNTSNVTDMGNMFGGTYVLNQLTLGEDFAFACGAALPPVPQDETYTGYWKNVGTRALINPLGALVFTSEQLMENFDGATMAGTWVWQRRADVPAPLPFTDVPSTAWFHDAVAFVYNEGIMRGASATAFDPQANFNREQVVATLFRMHHGRPSNAGDPTATPFDDVGDRWYAPYIAWAFAQGIVTGQTATTFGTGDPVTRQDFAVLMHRFARFTGADLSIPVGFTPQFPDAGAAGSWAQDALAWAVYNELIRGTDAGYVLPWGTATRAEAATILMRYVQAFGD